MNNWLKIFLIAALLVVAIVLLVMLQKAPVDNTPYPIKQKPQEPWKINKDNNVTYNESDQSVYKVPNVVHLTWYTEKPIELRFDKVVSVLSMVKNLKPEVIYFHTNNEPLGEHYALLKNISIFKVVHRDPPRPVFKKTFHETDYSDYDRVKILIEEGGMYFDMDVIVIRPMDELRKYDCTMGYVLQNKVCGGIILCSKNHPFLYMWLNSYYENFKSEFSYNSGVYPTTIIKRYPGLIHTERDTLNYPNWQQLQKIWGNIIYPWKKNYAIHTWIRSAMANKILKKYPTPESIKTMNSTYGQMVRDVYYGSPDIIN